MRRSDREGESKCQRVGTFQIRSIDRLMLAGVNHLIKKGYLGKEGSVFRPQDAIVYNKALRKRHFFDKLLKDEISINNWTPCELTAAQADLKYLNFSQLLLLLSRVAGSGRTSRRAGLAPCNQEHINFKETIEALIHERLLYELVRLQIKASSPYASDDTRSEKDDYTMTNVMENTMDSRAIGREILLTLGVILIAQESTTTESNELPTQMWWRMFVSRQLESQHKSRKMTNNEREVDFLKAARANLRPVTRKPTRRKSSSQIKEPLDTTIGGIEMFLQVPTLYITCRRPPNRPIWTHWVENDLINNAGLRADVLRFPGNSMDFEYKGQSGQLVTCITELREVLESRTSTIKTSPSKLRAYESAVNKSSSSVSDLFTQARANLKTRRTAEPNLSPEVLSTSELKQVWDARIKRSQQKEELKNSSTKIVELSELGTYSTVADDSKRHAEQRYDAQSPTSSYSSKSRRPGFVTADENSRFQSISSSSEVAPLHINVKEEDSKFYDMKVHRITTLNEGVLWSDNHIRRNEVAAKVRVRRHSKVDKLRKSPPLPPVYPRAV